MDVDKCFSCDNNAHRFLDIMYPSGICYYWICTGCYERYKAVKYQQKLVLKSKLSAGKYNHETITNIIW